MIQNVSTSHNYPEISWITQKIRYKIIKAVTTMLARKLPLAKRLISRSVSSLCLSSESRTGYRQPLIVIDHHQYSRDPRFRDSGCLKMLVYRRIPQRPKARKTSANASKSFMANTLSISANTLQYHNGLACNTW